MHGAYRVRHCSWLIVDFVLEAPCESAKVRLGKNQEAHIWKSPSGVMPEGLQSTLRLTILMHPRHSTFWCEQTALRPAAIPLYGES
jgi:hypothetical protein